MAAFVTYRHKSNFGILINAWREQRERPVATAEEP